LLVAAVPASAAPPVVASGSSPFLLCTADNAAVQQQFSTLYPNAEPEMRSDINPTNPLNLVGMYQQDRWNNGGARGLVASWTKDGGATWHPVVVPGISKCSGGIYDRASDPWLSFAPNGDLYAISLSFDVFDTHNAIIVNKSTNGGESWGPPLEVTADNTNGLDKQPITADPYNANRVYAVWDRFLSPPGINASDQGKIHAQSYVQQAWLSRTTSGGAGWEPPRVLFNPGTHAGTIGSIIVVLPNATHDLIDGFILFADHKSKIRGSQIAVVRSTDHGATWSQNPIIVAQTDRRSRGRSTRIRAGRSAAGSFPTSRSTRRAESCTPSGRTTPRRPGSTRSFLAIGGRRLHVVAGREDQPDADHHSRRQSAGVHTDGESRRERHRRRHLLRSPVQHPGSGTADRLLARPLLVGVHELVELVGGPRRGVVRRGASRLRARVLPRRLRRPDDERQRLPAVLRPGRQPRRRQPERRPLQHHAVAPARMTRRGPLRRASSSATTEGRVKRPMWPC
jgi:hypothetical protein